MKTYFSVILIVITVFTGLKAQVDVKPMNPTETTPKVGALLRLINGFYVDTLNMNLLTEEAIVATLKQLDPHSSYISKEDVEKAN